MLPGSNIIIALDGMTPEKALRLARLLQGRVWGFKVNDLLFTSVITRLKKWGRVFADAKLHDIPNTVKNSVSRLSGQGADMISVHASGGVDMMRSAVRNAGRSRIVAVTVLTSQEADTRTFRRLLDDARKAKVHGIVCSAHELPLVAGGRLFTVVPGIRPAAYNKRKDDQKRIATPGQALSAGADFLVVGRPVTRARDPRAALRRIVKEL